MIRGKSRPIRKSPDFSLMAQIHNKWLVEVVDAETGEVKQRAKGLNVILDQWWDHPLDEFARIGVGKGSGTPSASDTALFSELGRVNATGTSDTSHIKDGYISVTFSAQIAPGTFVGETLTEVGLYHQYSSGLTTYYSLATHAMLQDMNGNPISIVKTATDIVNIYATTFLHFDPSGFQNGSVLLTDAPGYLFAMIGGYFSTGSNRMTMYLSKAAGRSGTMGTANFQSSSFTRSTKTVKAETLDVIETVKVDKVKAEIAETAKDDQTLETNKVDKVNVLKADLEIVQVLAVVQVLVLLLLQWKKQRKYQLKRLSQRKRQFILAKIEKKN